MTATDPANIPEPEDWATKDDPATEAQINLIATLSKQANQQAPSTEGMTKAQASEKIEELRAANGLEPNPGSQSTQGAS